MNDHLGTASAVIMQDIMFCGRSGVGGDSGNAHLQLNMGILQDVGSSRAFRQVRNDQTLHRGCYAFENRCDG